MAEKKDASSVAEKHKDAEAKHAKAEAKLAKAEALKEKAKAKLAKAEAAAVKMEKLGGGPVQGFVNFIREKGVVGLAIGLAIGTAATGLVNQIVNSVITPTVSLVLSWVNLGNLKQMNYVAKYAADGTTPLITYSFGELIDALIKFIAIAAVIYFVVMGLRLDKLDKKKE